MAGARCVTRAKSETAAKIGFFDGIFDRCVP